MEENVVVIREPKTFSFDFDWPNNADRNLKHEIELIIKRNDSLAEDKIKKETEQIMLTIIVVFFRVGFSGKGCRFDLPLLHITLCIC